MRVIITGVSRGLGRALVDGMIAADHIVAGCARTSSAIADLQTAYPSPHRFDAVDVVEEASVNTWAAQVIETFGVPDLLINNAALINENAPLWEVPSDEFSRVIDVNVKGMFHVTKAFLPAMIHAGRGIVANFSSTWGRTVSSNVAPYCSTKWAVEGLTQALATELPDGLAAIPVNPGIINTNMLQSCFGESAQRFPDATNWADRAVPFVLALTTAENGHPVSVP